MTKPANGFTPIFDCVKQFEGKDGKKLGHLTALIYGVVWRYCNFKRKDNPIYIVGECWASFATIGEIADTSPKTVQRRMAMLVGEGFLEKRGTHPTLKTTIYAITPKVVVNNMTAIVADFTQDSESYVNPITQDSESYVNPATQDSESMAPRTQSPPIDTSIDTSNDSFNKLKESLGKISDENFSDPPISHLELSGCLVYAIEDEKEVPYRVIKATDKCLRVATGEGPKDNKLLNPEKTLVVYRNNGTTLRMVIQGSKEKALTDDQKLYFDKLSELFPAGETAVDRVKAQHYSELRQLAINVEGSYELEIIEVWSDWMDKENPTLSKGIAYFSKTLDQAVEWYEEQ